MPYEHTLIKSFLFWFLYFEIIQQIFILIFFLVSMMKNANMIDKMFT